MTAPRLRLVAFRLTSRVLLLVIHALSLFLGELVVAGLLPALARIVMMQRRARASVVMGIQQSGVLALVGGHANLLYT